MIDPIRVRQFVEALHLALRERASKPCLSGRSRLWFQLAVGAKIGIRLQWAIPL
jgi:hypothetical protein